MITFGKPHGPHRRTHSLLLDHRPATGLTYTWELIVRNADEALLEDILTALDRGSDFRNTMLLTAICSGWDGLTTPLGKNRKLKRTARRFAYHCIATIDAAVPPTARRRYSGVLMQREYAPFIAGIQESFRWLTPPSKSKPNGPLTDDEALLARAYCIIRGNGLEPVEKAAVHAVAADYEDLTPYFDILRSYGSVTLGDIGRLLDTKPELALAEGAL